MNKITLHLLGLSAACFLVGCASVGTPFKHENVQNLDLGTLRKGEDLTMFGKSDSPWVKMNTPDGLFEQRRYVFSHANLGTGTGRVLDLEFKDGVLNSYYYLSNFSEDATLADANAAQRLAKGQTKEEVLRIMGKPSGKSLYPSYHPDFKAQWEKAGAGAEMWLWSSMKPQVTFGKYQTEGMEIFVVFDKDGKVVNATKKSATQE